MYACNMRVKYIHVMCARDIHIMCARYNIKTCTYNVCEGVPPAPLPPPKRVFAPTPPPGRIRNAFLQISDSNCLIFSVLYLLPCMAIMYAHIRTRVCKRN